MEVKNIVRLDIMEGKPRTFVYGENLQNGFFLEIIGKANNSVLDIADREAYDVKLATADTKVEDMLFHKSVENMYDERLLKCEFELVAGRPGRGFVPTRNDIVTIPLAMTDLNGEEAEGTPLYLAEGGKLSTTGTAMVAKVEEFDDIEIPMYGGQFGVVSNDVIQKSVVIRFI